MRDQRSWRNPPSTNYQRPTERKFYIWQDRHTDYSGYGAYQRGRWGRHPWRWMCTYCEPPSYGFLARKDAFRRIIATSMPKHFEHRRCHHKWVASRKG